MANLLRSGATMLSYSCPECSSPLFQLKSGEIWCASCQRRVVVAPEGKEAAIETGIQLESLEKVMFKKLVFLEELIEKEEKLDRLKLITEVIDHTLLSLEKLKRLRKEYS